MEIDLPDDLERFSACAHRRGQTPSALLCELAERELAEHEPTDPAERAREIRALLANPGHHGGDSTRWLREQRRGPRS